MAWENGLDSVVVGVGPTLRRPPPWNCRPLRDVVSDGG